MKRKALRIGLIGTGFMGMAHMFGYASAARVFDLPFEIELDCIADATSELAEKARKRFGFRRAAESWQSLVGDPAIDLVDITTPNDLHCEMALAAIDAGKHVYCEKPLSVDAESAMRMAKAAESAGVTTHVGFNYLANPMFALARQMVAEGALGQIRSFRGIHSEDYMGDADAPWSWRQEKALGGGAFADLGSHALATAEFLLGPIAELQGDVVTAIPERKGRDGRQTPSEVDDLGRAFARFASGATGTIEASWVATGQKMQHDFEIYGSKGAVTFTQERLSELRHFDVGGESRFRGFRTILAGPDHEPYGNFCRAPGHQLGYNDLKAIEIRNLIEAIAGLREEPFNFAAGARIQYLVDRVHESSERRSWLRTDALGGLA